MVEDVRKRLEGAERNKKRKKSQKARKKTALRYLDSD